MFLKPHPLHAVQRAALTCLLAGTALHAAAQSAPARAQRPAAATPVAPAPTLATAPTVAPVATAAVAPRQPTPALVCTQVEEAVLPLSSGLTTRFTPSSPVQRLVLDDQAPLSGVPGGAGDAAGAAPAGATGALGLVGREPVNAQAVAPRPGVGEITVRLLSPNDIYFTGKRIG